MQFTSMLPPHKKKIRLGNIAVSMGDLDLDEFSQFLTSLTFPKLTQFLLEQFSRENADEDVLDETFDYFLFYGAGGLYSKTKIYWLFDSELEWSLEQAALVSTLSSSIWC